jgi:hypothetical protein
MKTKYKFIILIIFACILSIIIYNHIESFKSVDIKEDILVEQSNIEDKYLNNTKYSASNPKIILNPYGISPLTALVIFETNDLTTPKITIVGKDESTTIKNTFTPSKKHILPIYGLYPDTNNEVILEVNNKKYKLNIKTDKLPNDMILPTDVMNNKEDSTDNKLYFVTPSSTGYTAAYDNNGDVRWYLTDKYLWDIKTLNNGNLLLSTNRLINNPYYTTGLTEMDLTGKIYYEYSLPGGYHHDVYEMDNGNLLVATNDFSSGTVEDVIVELDRQTGNIVKTIDLKKILNQNDGKSLNWTTYDWFHNNAVWYDNKTNSITLSSRHKDAVVNINYDTNDINWILGDSTGWNKKYKKYFFKKDNDTQWQWGQHASMILPNGNVFLFDNGNNRSKNKKDALPADKNYSRGVIYELDTNKMTAKEVWSYGKERGSSYYSPYISDVDYLDENHYLINSGGHSEYKGKTNNVPAGMTKADKLTSYITEIIDDEVVFELTLPTNTYRTEKLSLYNDSKFKTGKGTRLGSIGKTKEDGMIFNPLISSKKVDKEYKSHNISITKEVDRLVINGTFKKGTNVKIVLDNVFDNKYYNMAISKRPYTAMCVDVFNSKEKKNGINVTKYINAEGLSGKYYIYIKINNKLYNTRKYVKF